MNIYFKKNFNNFNLNINMKINKGEILGIVGKSGSGKSTVLKILQGIIKVDSGNLKEIETLNKSYIFQNFNLLNNLNVFDNVNLALKIKKISNNEKVNEILNFTSLNDKKEEFPSNLSGGEKQRVAIARALISNPELLLCDEFSSQLDDIVKNEILDLFKMINEKYKISIIIVTHELDVIKKICDRVYVMEDGKIIGNLQVNKSKNDKKYTNYLDYVKEAIK